MTTPPPSSLLTAREPGPDPARSRVRTAVARVERALPPAAVDGTQDGVPLAPDELRDAWTALVDLLALGPEPALRPCHVCNQLGMREASRCGHCWAVLAPLPPVAP